MNVRTLRVEITEAIRKRIVTHFEDHDLVLHEGKIAQEYSVSRTPIRQVLQALATENLLEVRSGIGTVAKPLRAQAAQADQQSFAAILQACAQCASSEGLGKIAIEFTTSGLHLDNADVPDVVDNFFDATSIFANGLGAIIEDDILQEALTSCYWRFIRRRVQFHSGDFANVAAEIRGGVAVAETAIKTGNGATVMAAVSDWVKSVADRG